MLRNSTLTIVTTLYHQRRTLHLNRLFFQINSRKQVISRPRPLYTHFNNRNYTLPRNTITMLFNLHNLLQRDVNKVTRRGIHAHYNLFRYQAKNNITQRSGTRPLPNQTRSNFQPSSATAIRHSTLTILRHLPLLCQCTRYPHLFK